MDRKRRRKRELKLEQSPDQVSNAVGLQGLFGVPAAHTSTVSITVVAEWVSCS